MISCLNLYGVNRNIVPEYSATQRKRRLDVFGIRQSMCLLAISPNSGMGRYWGAQLSSNSLNASWVALIFPTRSSGGLPAACICSCTID